MEASAAWMLSFALHYVLQLAVLVRAMTRPEREPASRLAWMLVILAVPGAGVVLYLLLGEVNPGRRVLARLRRQRADLPVMPPGAVPVRLHFRNTGPYPVRFRSLVFGREVETVVVRDRQQQRLLSREGVLYQPV